MCTYMSYFKVLVNFFLTIEMIGFKNLTELFNDSFHQFKMYVHYGKNDKQQLTCLVTP